MRKVNKPRVLLIGSGILQAFGGESWEDFLMSIKKRENIDDIINELGCPEPLKAILITNDQIDVAMREKCSHILKRGNLNCELAMVLQRLLTIDFDYILTTNYTYELEQAAIYPAFLTRYKLDKMATSTAGRVEPKYLIHTYNGVFFKDKIVKIWHIHGEAKKPNSTILGHYYYGNSLFKIREKTKEIENAKYKRREAKGSWVEAFLYGDVYCLGFGFSFAEFDLWWLLNRKKEEKESTGILYFYEPYDKSSWSKIEMFNIMKKTNGEPLVKVINLGMKKENIVWKNFYTNAIVDIEEKLSDKRTDSVFNNRELIIV